MKRKGNLFPQILDRENLRRAFWKAAKGKRHRPETQEFASNLERNLRAMSDQLSRGEFSVGNYHQFLIHDPKRRVITAPAFHERVLHHAIMLVCEPVFERFLIFDSYACRLGKGRIAALSRAQRFARHWEFFLKLDVRQYFHRIVHHTLLDKLARRFKDSRLLDLFRQIIDSHHTQAGRGLPIGSLTSQHFANFYLGWLDRFVKETLRIKGFVRYMDDCLLWADSTRQLQTVLNEVEGFLAHELGLELTPHPYINRSEHGVEFLGCRVYPDHLVLTRRSRKRFRRKLRMLEVGYKQGDLSEQELQQRGTALIAFTTTPMVKSWQFRRKLIQHRLGNGQEPPTG